jgi:hypothetical protein
MSDRYVFERGDDEIDYVDECPDCGASFVGMTPDDVRQHIVEDHGDPLGDILCWPTDEARQRQDEMQSVDTETDDGGAW